MGNRRAYEIAFVGLKPGNHTFQYEIDDKFFEPYGAQDFHNCHARISLELDKQQASFMLLRFDIDGQVDTQCDRCGNPLTLQLWDEFNIVVKMVDEPQALNEQEEDPDVYYIGKTESHLHLEDWIYEFINLSIPNQHVCGEDADGKSLCNPEVLAKLEQMEKDASDAENSANSIWKGLERFKGNMDEN